VPGTDAPGALRPAIPSGLFSCRLAHPLQLFMRDTLDGKEILMKKGIVVGIVVAISLFLAVLTLVPQTADEATRTAIRQASLDYIEGWFEGNAERMDRALHAQLAKRLVVLTPQTGQERFTHLTKEQMIQYTKQGGGSRVPADQRGIKVTILDMTQTMAFVRSDCSQFIDYLTLAKCEGGQWKIVNVLWENVTK
jgi:hypothetical protein